jgi:NAD(P)H-hydrate repair Nnr-like enzyme with NAD(P)H-hydrate dehydratase domain
LAAAQALAEISNCVVVLKGSGTVIAENTRTPIINHSGNAKLATAGTGDVLAGLIGAQLANTNNPFEATCEAVYRHGALADVWPEDGPSLTASQLVTAIR